MDNDILEMFQSDHEPFKEANESVPETNNKSKGNNENLYSRKDYQPLEVDISNFTRTGKSFTVYVPDGVEIPGEVVSKLKNIVTSLTENGYTIRVNCDGKSIVNDLVKDVNNKENYLPWGRFNEHVEKFSRPDYASYRIALGLRKNFFQLPDAVRAIIASNVQTVYGKKCKDPVDFIVAYSESGADLTTDYKTIKIDVEKNLYSIMHIAKKGGILYFNIKNDDAIGKLKEVIKNSG